VAKVHRRVGCLFLKSAQSSVTGSPRPKTPSAVILLILNSSLKNLGAGRLKNLAAGRYPAGNITSPGGAERELCIALATDAAFSDLAKGDFPNLELEGSSRALRQRPHQRRTKEGHLLAAKRKKFYYRLPTGLPTAERKNPLPLRPKVLSNSGKDSPAMATTPVSPPTPTANREMPVPRTEPTVPPAQQSVPEKPRSIGKAAPSKKRRLSTDLLGVLVGALTVFVAISLLGYNPGDPPFPHLAPAHREPANPCGLVGAYLAWALLSLFGAGAYLLVIFLGLASGALFCGGIRRLPVRIIGALLAVASLSTLVGALRWPYWHGPVIGPAGWVGMLSRVLAEQYLAATGIAILAAGTLAAGILLATEYFVFRLIYRGVLQPPLMVLLRTLQPTLRRWGWIRRARSVRLKAERVAAAGLPGAVPVRRPKSVPLDLSAPEADRAPADAPPPSSQIPAPSPAVPPPTTVGEAIRIRNPRAPRADDLRAEIEAHTRHQIPDHYILPPLELLLPGEPFCFEKHERDVRQKAAILEKTFADFGYRVKVVEIQTGPVIAQFEVELEAGLRVSKIMALADDLAIALRVPSVRIVAPIPGKNTVAIEVPNAERQIVRLREVMEEAGNLAHGMRIPIFLGKDVAGNPIVADLTSLPHLLIAGRTGTGKSVCLNAIIMSILMCRRPDEVRLLLIDPKMVELSPYKRIPHLLHPVVTDMRKAEAILGWAVDKMEERYQLLARVGVRHLSQYNQLGEDELRHRLGPIGEEERNQIPRRLPYIVIVADEMADLMMTAAKEVETHIIRLAQKSRAVGIHLVLATQKPTVDVVTGLIKSNLPARICFEVSSRIDSRVVLDEMGAERLLGNGDMLFLRPGSNTLIRGQGTFVSDEEINRVVAAIATSDPDYLEELVELRPAGEGESPQAGRIRDDLYETAVEIVLREGRGSVSLLQRALGIGYGRAARLIDYMAEDGIVGPYNGSQAREVLMTLAQWEARKAQQSAGSAPGAVTPARTHRILYRPGEQSSPAATPESTRFPGDPTASREASSGGSSLGGPIGPQYPATEFSRGPIPGEGTSPSPRAGTEAHSPPTGPGKASGGSSSLPQGSDPPRPRGSPSNGGPHWPRN
jgi:S-DNA-T family DNA segregation ATPase FtsK/SpoIIIE